MTERWGSRFERPLGAAALARLSLGEDERLLWATMLFGARRVGYDVRGLDEQGQPKRSLLGRGASAAANVAGGAALTVLAGGGDGDNGSRPDAPRPPMVVPFGGAPDCLAAQLFRRDGLPDYDPILVALTAGRLAVLVQREEPEESKPTSMLGKAARFGLAVGKGLAESGKAAVDIFSDRVKYYGRNVEGKPVWTPEMAPFGEMPRDRIGGVAPAQRRALKQDFPCLRVSFVDDSGLDLVLGGQDPSVPVDARADGGRAMSDLAAWLQPGERLMVRLPAVPGWVGARIGGTQAIPYTPARRMPEVHADPPRWPLPTERPMDDEDWPDDPTLAYWVWARDPEQDAVRFADHFAAGRAQATLVITDRRLAIVYPRRVLEPPAEPAPEGYTTFEESAGPSLRALTAPHVGRSAPPSSAVRLDFHDGSTLLVAHPEAAHGIRHTGTWT
ncbi:hypothetical protein EV193_1011021 [Herbihabitans rhizosphaerae]|uniref:Uncharacterized protein n=1 Tax=Herbihabitans rhizosphaerae TaxID=1872711 RepID=A0A4Q7L724_9PSEU|nr:hypothetical protein [Herbihabitans rhizosphaerae]RZS45134.1 hypothetical protein EV193_1011021 [Herbihabitans rhizosphaerae]